MTKGKGVNPVLVRLASREALIGAAFLRRLDVETAVGVVSIREFTAKLRQEYFDRVMKPSTPEGEATWNKFIISLGVVNEDGSLMFASAEDVPDMRMDVMNILTHEILVISGMIREVKAEIPNATRKGISNDSSVSSSEE